MSVTTLHQILEHTLARFPRDDAFTWREHGVYRSVSTADFSRQALALGLHDLKIEPDRRVALLSENRIEWAISDLALLSVGEVSIPICGPPSIADPAYPSDP